MILLFLIVGIYVPHTHSANRVQDIKLTVG